MPCVWVPHLIVVTSRLLCEPPGQRSMLNVARARFGLISPGIGFVLTTPSLDHMSIWPSTELLPMFSKWIKGYIDRKGWLREGVIYLQTFLASFPSFRLEFQLFQWTSPPTCSTGTLNSTFPKLDSLIDIFQNWTH